MANDKYRAFGVGPAGRRQHRRVGRARRDLAYCLKFLGQSQRGLLCTCSGAYQDTRTFWQMCTQPQRHLGSLNDAATVERLCEALRDDPQDTSVSEILGLARGWSSATARAYIERLPEAWKRFRQCDPFWKEE